MRDHSAMRIGAKVMRGCSLVCALALDSRISFLMCGIVPFVCMIGSAGFIPPVTAAQGDDQALNENFNTAQAELSALQKKIRHLNKGLGNRLYVSTPLDLTNYYHRKAETFDKETRYPSWKIVPRGPHTFYDVPFQIGGMITLWGERNANQGQNFRDRSADIEVKRTFSTLFVYHATFFESKDETPVYEIVFHFADGTSETDVIKYADDVRDWYDRFGAPTLPYGMRSHLAWHGECVQGDQVQPLRFCMTAVQNPKPTVEVTTIELVSCRFTSAGCIMAMTTAVSAVERDGAPPEASASDTSNLKMTLEAAVKQRDSARERLKFLSNHLEKIEQEQTGADAVATPLDLTSVYTTSAEKFAGLALFPNFKDLIWGKHTFLDVPFKIDGMFILHGADAANHGLSMNESVSGIPVKKVFETLYIYHTTISEADESTPLYRVVFNYRDGTRQFEQVLYADDVRNGIYPRPQSPDSAVPLGLRSKLAWHTISDARGENALDLCCYLTAVENPKPDLEVESLDFVSSDAGPAGIIMGLTIGKSKLIP